jgi:hypothetical protein
MSHKVVIKHTYAAYVCRCWCAGPACIPVLAGLGCRAVCAGGVVCHQPVVCPHAHRGLQGTGMLLNMLQLHLQMLLVTLQGLKGPCTAR